MLLVLTAISVVSGSSLAFFERVTREPIQYQRLKFVKGPAVLAVLTGYENDPIKDYKKDVLLEKKGETEIRKSIFPAIKDGRCFAIAFEVTGEGYHGTLGIMLGIDINSGSLTGIRVMTHTETPGLGAKAVEPEFHRQFHGMGMEEVSLTDKGGKINAISGATITSNGVTDAVKKGLELFAASKEAILNALKSG